MSFVTPYRLAIATAVISLSLGAALAQQPGRRPGGFGGFGGFTQSPGQEKLAYLANEAVQKELELADDQKADLRKVGEEAQAKGREFFTGFQGFRDLSEAEQEKRRTELRQKQEALGKDVSKKVAAILLPHQGDRLQEIWVQVRGTSVLSDPDIAKELGLTDKQKEQLTAVGDAIRERMRSGGQQGGQQNFAERFAAIRKERDEKSLAVLTAEQKEKFEKMKGEPFAAVDALRQTGFGGGRPGQGGQGRPGGQGGQGGQQRTRPGGNNPNN
jgi:Spy/CpxP family protein refolding chaperone